MHETHIKCQITQQIQTAVAEVDYNIFFSYPHPQTGGFDRNCTNIMLPEYK